MSNDLPNRKSNRMKGYDYSQDGWYFITSCVRDRQPFFGEIQDGSMIKNKYGEIIEKQWLWIADQYTYIRIDTYVVMPDHFHGIIRILTEGMNMGIKIKPLDQIIGAWKTTSSKMIHRADNNVFAWQRSYHDHIIRDDISLMNIREYIRNNPKNWGQKKIHDILPIIGSTGSYGQESQSESASSYGQVATCPSDSHSHNKNIK